MRSIIKHVGNNNSIQFTYLDSIEKAHIATQLHHTEDIPVYEHPTVNPSAPNGKGSDSTENLLNAVR